MLSTFHSGSFSPGSSRGKEPISPSRNRRLRPSCWAGVSWAWSILFPTCWPPQTFLFHTCAVREAGGSAPGRQGLYLLCSPTHSLVPIQLLGTACLNTDKCSTNLLVTLLLLLLSRFSHVQLCATPEMAAHQAPPSLGFSRQEHWSGLPFPSPMHESEK